MRTSVAAAAVLTVGALLAAPTTASAAGETCNGQAATAVGSLNSSIDGTAGRDVVVTNGAATVATGDGDDLVCVTPGPGGQATSGSPTTPLMVIVSTGAGDDVVVSAGVPSPGDVVVELGAGSDTFTGRATHVDAGEKTPSGPPVDAERDSVDVQPTSPDHGAPGVTSGQSDLPNADVVRVSAHGQVFWYGQPADGAELTAAGSGRLWVSLPAGEVVADLAAGSLTADGGTPLRFTGFAAFVLVPGRSTPGLRISGSAGRDDVSVGELTQATRIDVSLGDGADVLRTTTTGAAGSTIDAGGGQDRLEAEATDRLRIDLARHRAGDLAVRGFEDVNAVAPKVTVRGDGEANRVEVAACRLVVAGRGGADKLFTVYDYQSLVEPTRCSSPTVARMTGGAGDDSLVAQRGGDDVMLGGAGDDRLWGGRGADRLLGGPGRDRVVGGTGPDTCDGERVTGCERLR